MRIEVHNRCSDFKSYRAARVKSLFNAEAGLLALGAGGGDRVKGGFQDVAGGVQPGCMSRKTFSKPLSKRLWRLYSSQMARAGRQRACGLARR